jgi:hypothetical protein
MPRCRNCDRIVSYDARRCPQCGERDPAPQIHLESGSAPWWSYLVYLALIALGIYVGWTIPQDGLLKLAGAVAGGWAGGGIGAKIMDHTER